MRLADLSPELRGRVSGRRWDRIIEKHEGPWEWRYWVEDGDAEFLTIDGFDVLLPVGAEHHPNITILRTIPSADGNSLTIFLKDTTWYDDPLMSGFLAVCDRFETEPWYIAIAYHEWFIIEES
jgi:hypothetical protein